MLTKQFFQMDNVTPPVVQNFMLINNIISVMGMGEDEVKKSYEQKSTSRYFHAMSGNY